MTIVELLLEQGRISRDQYAQALELRKSQGLRLDRALVKLGFFSEDDLLAFISEQLAIPIVTVNASTVQVEALNTLPAKLVFKKRLLPMARHNGTLTVATSDPFDLYAFDEIRLLTGLEIEPVLALEADIDKAIKALLGVGGDTIDAMVGSDNKNSNITAGSETEDLLNMAQEASVIKLVNEIFLEAINERSSDIHIEPYNNDLSIRYRIDGVLSNTTVSPQIKQFQAAIISRIKIMANLNIAEKRLPQDGRINLSIGQRQIDLRVSVIPMLYGEGVVMRILDKSNVLLTLPQLGMAADTFATFNELIARPHGIILVTGPTGSGKTTTLYAALQAIIGPEIKVITVEDPVEYNLQGVNQIQVQSKIGLTFAHGLRAILRHDPDVVMIGEIRDQETADAATQASLTGHLVLSTLHTNDACSAATRLIDMGVEPFLVASTLIGSMAQRLVRTVCKECRQAYDPNPRDLPPDFKWDGRKLFRGAGCKTCRGTGYRGRAGLYELMVANDAIAEKILTRSPSNQLVKVAKETSGLRLLREDGWIKVLEGRTTPGEVVGNTNVASS